ncbi:MAG: IS5 family transposase [Burkholderiales bacterium]|nr:IS5 family transposase [Burkholderiales bacterium]
MKQTTFASMAWAAKGKKTRRELFLAEMDAVVPWARLLALIEPHYPKAGDGRPPLPMELMLRVYFMQQWFNLSDPQAEDSLYDSESMRRFAGVELAEDKIPDESTILRFRHLLEEHQLTQAIFLEVRGLLEDKGLLLKSGTIVDATIIAAPSSTKNAEGKRDPEMRQTRKGKDWHFGMKVHVGTTKQGLVHSLATGPASEGDITRLDDLLHGEETELYADQAYWSEDHRQHCRHAGIRYRVNRRGHSTRPLTAHQRLINRSRSRCRARGEHAFHVVKRLWGFAKVRYRGLAKNTARVFAIFALANLYLARRRLLPQGARCAL